MFASPASIFALDQPTAESTVHTWLRMIPWWGFRDRCTLPNCATILCSGLEADDELFNMKETVSIGTFPATPRHGLQEGWENSKGKRNDQKNDGPGSIHSAHHQPYKSETHSWRLILSNSWIRSTGKGFLQFFRTPILRRLHAHSHDMTDSMFIMIIPSPQALLFTGNPPISWCRWRCQGT